MGVADSHSGSSNGPSLRSDARRNRQRILCAARETFAERGLDAPVSAIARRAGVGIATVYRRFPTRDAIVAEVFADQFHRCDAELEEALNATDPWRGLVTLVYRICGMQVADRGFTEAFFAEYASIVQHEHLARAEQRLSTLLDRCRHSGQVRAEVIASDITLALVANAGLVARLPEPGRASARLIGQLLRSFATDPTQSLPPLPPAPGPNPFTRYLLR